MSNKDEILISVYGRNAPGAAKFGVGATALAEVQKAIDARRELSDEQSTSERDPIRHEQ
jgi:hypothetical protein